MPHAGACPLLRCRQSRGESVGVLNDYKFCAWKRQLTAFLRAKVRMNTDIRAHEGLHLSGDGATRTDRVTLAALLALQAAPSIAWPFAMHGQSTGLPMSGLSLAGMSPQRRRALPAHRIVVRSGASNCRFQVESDGFGTDRPRPEPLLSGVPTQSRAGCQPERLLFKQPGAGRIAMDKIGKVRRMHRRDNKSVRKIARLKGL